MLHSFHRPDERLCADLPEHLFQGNVMKPINSLVLASVAIAVVYPVGASADDNKEHGSAQAAKQQPAGTADMADGEVRKVDKDNKKITLKHGEIKSLDMPPMTMVFRVGDPGMLDKLQAGDKVKFKATISDGAIVVTEIQQAR